MTRRENNTIDLRFFNAMSVVVPVFVGCTFPPFKASRMSVRCCMIRRFTAVRSDNPPIPASASATATAHSLRDPIAYDTDKEQGLGIMLEVEVECVLLGKGLDG